MHTWSWMADTHDPMLPVLQGRDSPTKKPAKARQKKPRAKTDEPALSTSDTVHT
jgi:hypothetical protein